MNSILIALDRKHTLASLPARDNRRNQGLRPRLCGLLALLLLALGWMSQPARATIPEPDNVVWGAIKLGTQTVTAANKDIIVEARRSLAGAALARYRMGDNAAASDYYYLRLGVESLTPIASPYASNANTPIVIVVLDGTGVRAQKLFVIGVRGLMTRLDIGDIDSDGNGLPDDWERLFFWGQIGQNPNADPDFDGLTNLKEYQSQSNPLFPDARHPADNNPTNNSLSIVEVTAYGLAWKTGKAWPIAPATIPVDYVTRAAYLWRNGETYALGTNFLFIGAPLWWTNVATTNIFGPGLHGAPRPAGVETGGPSGADSVDSSVIRTLPLTYRPGVAIPVTITVIPSSMATAYAIEEEAPSQWEVSAIGSEGSLDPTSGKVKWGPFFDAEPRTLTYEVTPAGESPSPAVFSGVGSFDGANLDISGALQVERAMRSQFIAPFLANADGFSFTHLGEPGLEYDIEVSFDLTTWRSLIRLKSNDTGRLDFRDSSAAADQQRFYRARLVN